MEVDFNIDQHEMALDADLEENISNLNKTEISIENIINSLISNEKVVFKSQQRGEAEPNQQEKHEIAMQLYKKSITNFLIRFGRCLNLEQLNFFKQFASQEQELKVILSDLYKLNSSYGSQKQIKNRRYQKLRQLIEENSYFSEVEMMKRNPLLYQQLVGQYLSEEEKKERDKFQRTNMTFVGILMEGMERDAAEAKLKEQKDNEKYTMEEEDSSNSENSKPMNTSQPPSNESSLDGFENAPTVKWGEFHKEDMPKWGEYSQPSGSIEMPNSFQLKLDERVFRKYQQNKNPGPQWGEFSNNKVNKTPEAPRKVIPKCTNLITAEERILLRNEFTTLMYQSFLDGKDNDFDYDSVDYNDSYDNLDIIGHDEEEKYFDSEEPEDVLDTETSNLNDSSEDELDVYMSALNNHPAVVKLTKEIQKL